jgi:hypothetical protein
VKLSKFLLPILALFGCGIGFHETTTPAGIPNLVNFAPRMWRMGQPPNAAAWKELAGRIAPNGEKVVIVKLNDGIEGSDEPALDLGWVLFNFPMPPEDDKPWTLAVKPSVEQVTGAVQAIYDAYQRGYVVAWHCSHGRDRTSLISALEGKKIFGWSRSQMEKDMTDHGFRWVDVDLTAYFLEDAASR